MKEEYLIDYYKKNIDVHINWLLFLNSFSSITTKGFLTAAPIIESVRKDAYIRVNPVNTDTRLINYDVVELITEIIKEKGLEEVIPYIGKDIEEKDILNMTSATYIRSNILRRTSENPALSYFENTLRGINMVHSIKINGYSEELLNYYLESLRIKGSKNAKIEHYLIVTITILETINRLSSEEEFELDKNLLNEVTTTSMISDVSSLISLFNSQDMELFKDEEYKKTLKNNQ